MRATSFVTALAIYLPFVCAEPTSLRLFHRLFHPSTGPTPFTQRGSLLIDENNAVSFQLTASFAHELSSFGDTLRTLGREANLALYQVALERSGDKTEAEWDVSSVKACHLRKDSSESIYLHTGPHDSNPYAIDYFKATEDASPFHAFASNHEHLNTTVILKSPRHPPLPTLAVPPPVSPEGEPIVPLPEKSFLEKYWMYIVAFLLITLVTGGGGEEEKPKGQ